MSRTIIRKGVSRQDMIAMGKAKCQRVCVICGTAFAVKRSDHVGRTCSKPCLSELIARQSRGRKHSAETIAKRSASLKASWRKPESDARRAAAAAMMKTWLSDPVNAKVNAERSSERMKKRHTDPAFQKRRDARSSKVFRDLWDNRRDHMLEQTLNHVSEMQQSGSGIFSEESKARKAEANKWIMKKAQEALHNETDYVEVFTEVQERLRRETPYDGSGDYYDYCRKMGTAVVNSPECREIADSFLSKAIPRFAEEWKRKKHHGVSDA